MRKPYQVRSLNFVVDNVEMINCVKNGHNAVLKYGKTMDGHTIADCIAYANYRGWSLSPKVIEHKTEFEEDFHSSVLNIINKKLAVDPTSAFHKPTSGSYRGGSEGFAAYSTR